MLCRLDDCDTRVVAEIWRIVSMKFQVKALPEAVK